MARPINFRSMKPADAEAVSELCIRIFDEFVAHTCKPEGRQDFVVDTSPAEMRSRAETNYVILAFDEERLVGVVDMRKDGYLKLLFIGKDYQNRGIGRKLLSLCIEAATSEGKRPSKIELKSAINTVSYYEKLGFKKDDDIKEMNGIRYVPMSLKLDS